MSSTTGTPSERPQRDLVWLSRMAARGFAYLFMIGIGTQFYLAGISLFKSADYWDDHRSLGELLGIFPVLLIVAAVVGRLPSRLIGMSVVLLGLWFIQIMLPRFDNGWIAALHPLNAIILFGLSVDLENEVRDLTRAAAPTRGAST